MNWKAKNLVDSLPEVGEQLTLDGVTVAMLCLCCGSIGRLTHCASCALRRGSLPSCSAQRDSTIPLRVVAREHELAAWRIGGQQAVRDLLDGFDGA